MSAEPRPLNVVVISEHVPLLHEVSWTLECVGYKVQTTHDFAPEALWRRYSFTDIVIVDSRGVSEPTAETFAHDSDDPLYRIFLYDPTKRTDFAAWYAAGANDAIRIPLSRGELLTRVRTGARYLEFERRLQHQSARSTVPGMYSRRGLLGKLRKLAAGNDLSLAQCTLLMTAIDWYPGIRRKSGETASRNLANTTARAIRRAVGENVVSAYVGDGRFATLFVGQSPAAIKSIAETLAKDFASRDSLHESMPRPTLTSAIVPWTAGSTVETFVNDALESLDLAVHSGGESVCLDGEFNQAHSAWKQEMSTGNPFANVVAQDIMQPFPALLPADADERRLPDGLRDSGIPVLPFVDHEGRLVAAIVADKSSDVARHPGNDTLAPPETISYDATFTDIYEAFSSRGCASLIVTDGGRPLGYLTFEGFLSLIDPVHAESFAHTDRPVDELAYLVVPGKTGEAVAAGVATA
jgi:GGDEF domain-containing protein